MKTYERVEVKLHVFLTSVLDGGEWSASRLGRPAHSTVAPMSEVSGSERYKQRLDSTVK
jgi:hypothetical protein